MSQEVHRAPADGADGEEVWQRLTDEPDIREVEAWTDGEAGGQVVEVPARRWARSCLRDRAVGVCGVRAWRAVQLPALPKSAECQCPGVIGMMMSSVPGSAARISLFCDELPVVLMRSFVVLARMPGSGWVRWW
jgi:hypothetical protein